MGIYKSKNNNLLFQDSGFIFKLGRGRDGLIESEGFRNSSKRLGWEDSKGTLVPKELLR